MRKRLGWGPKPFTEPYQISALTHEFSARRTRLSRYRQPLTSLALKGKSL